MEAIYAIDSKNGLSKDGYIPWKSKKDMSFFFNKTKNNVIIMGKKTFFSLPLTARPLKNRLNIVLTSTPELYANEDIANNKNTIFTSNDQIHNFILANPNKYLSLYPYLNKNFIIYFIGGKQIYEKYIPICNTIWVTKLKTDYVCDLTFNYDFDSFIEDIYEEDEELKIIKYTKQFQN